MYADSILIAYRLAGDHSSNEHDVYGSRHFDLSCRRVLETHVVTHGVTHMVLVANSVRVKIDEQTLRVKAINNSVSLRASSTIRGCNFETILTRICW